VTAVTCLFIVKIKEKEKKNPKKRNIKSRKIDKRKEKILVSEHTITKKSCFIDSRCLLYISYLEI